MSENKNNAAAASNPNTGITQCRDDRMAVIVTAGPTNERIDAVMKITNMSTGALGKKVAETMLNADGKHAEVAAQIRKLYYVSPKLAYKPVVPDGQAYKLELVQIESAMDLLDALSRICAQENGNVGTIVHSCAVGDYAAKYTARAEDLVAEIVRRQEGKGVSLDAGELLDIFDNPPSALNDDTKMSSYEPRMMTMMKLTPKVISRIRAMAPKACIFGFKLLENVTKEHLFDVASRLRQKNDANYIIANDLARIGGGKHPAMVIGRDNVMGWDAIFAECQDKSEIAEAICRLAFPGAYLGMAPLLPMPLSAKPCSPVPAVKTMWQAIAANNMNTDVRVEGFSSDKNAAWDILYDRFAETLQEMLPEAGTPSKTEARQGWEYVDRAERTRAKIDADGAQVYDGADMWYWNMVPVTEQTDGIPAFSRPAGWIACHGDGTPLQDAEVRGGYDAAWDDMYRRFAEAMAAKAPGIKVPDKAGLSPARTWSAEAPGLRADIGPSSACVYDGISMSRFTVEPVMGNVQEGRDDA